MNDENFIGPITTVAAILTKSFDNETRIILTRRARAPYEGHWCLPGGHILKIEKAEDAICREVREETGLSFHPKFFGVFDEIIPDRQHHHSLIAYHGTVEGELICQKGEVLEMQWFTLKEALREDLAFTNREVLQSYVDFTKDSSKKGSNRPNHTFSCTKKPKK